MTRVELALVLLLAPAAEPANTDVRVRLTLQGDVVSLSELEQSDLAGRVEALIVGCGINSEDSTAVLPAEPQQWRDALAGSHLYVRFPKPLKADRGELRISEAVIGFTDPSFIGPELSMHAGRLARHGKCDGHRSLALMCTPAVRSHLLPRQVANCEVFDRIGEPQEDK